MSTADLILPVELLIHVLEFASPATLANAARCSRKWHDIATPLLYRNIHLDLSQPNIHGFLGLKEMAVLLLTQPTLAAHVRHLSIRPGFRSAPDVEMNVALPETLKYAIEQASDDSGEYTALLKEVPTDDLFLALLLPALPNLVSLDVAGPSYFNHLHRILSHQSRLSQLVPAFRNLRSVFWTYEIRGYMQYGAMFCPGIFTLPGIRSIHLHRAIAGDEDDVDEHMLSLGHQTSNCTHLELRDCLFFPTNLERILRCPKGLISFVYEIGLGQSGMCIFNFMKMRRGLEVHKDTLEELCLNDAGVVWEYVRLEDSSPMASLVDFPRLRFLKISPRFAFGVSKAESDTIAPVEYQRLVDFLPRSLEQLHITHCSELFRLGIFTRALQDVMIRKSVCVPNLRRLILEIDSDFVETYTQRFMRVKQLAEDNGVILLLLNDFASQATKDCKMKVERRWGFHENIEWQKCSESENTRRVYEVIDI